MWGEERLYMEHAVSLCNRAIWLNLLYWLAHFTRSQPILLENQQSSSRDF
jgi:hypothetical protein